jgi:hypothetical protein
VTSLHIPTDNPVPDLIGVRMTVPPLLLECVAQTAQLGQEAGLPANWCVLAAHAMHGALHVLGHSSAQIIGVGVGALNPAATGALAADLPRALWPSTAYIGGIEGSDLITAEGWDGHAVLLVTERTPRGNRKWLLDPTLGQYSNPVYDLQLGPTVVRASREFLAGEPIQIALRSGTTLLYQRRPSLTGHHNLGDHSTLVVEMAATLASRLRC